eukprot:TRINITY_DN2802_c0_g1_i1.p1 TRINITY_DN2802_c0_g1~~TRINITY_DN2802_c0_g1_i1.p1  ORF type:complete len:275 (-),score=18.57 TRINITY_DN2802_c0_g1_i1:110-934(-)
MEPTREEQKKEEERRKRDEAAAREATRAQKKEEERRKRDEAAPREAARAQKEEEKGRKIEKASRKPETQELKQNPHQENRDSGAQTNVTIVHLPGKCLPTPYEVFMERINLYFSDRSSFGLVTHVGDPKSLEDEIASIAKFFQRHNASGVVGLGSDHAVREWLLEAYFPKKVWAVDIAHRQLHSKVSDRVSYLVRAKHADGTVFPVPAEYGLFLSYPVEAFENYFSSFRGNCIVMIADQQFPKFSENDDFFKQWGFKREKKIGKTYFYCKCYCK